MPCHAMASADHGMAFADRHRIDANEQREARGAHSSYGQTPLTQGQNFDPPPEAQWLHQSKADGMLRHSVQVL